MTFCKVDTCSRTVTFKAEIESGLCVEHIHTERDALRAEVERLKVDVEQSIADKDCLRRNHALKCQQLGEARTQLATSERFLKAEQEQCSRIGASNLEAIQMLGGKYPEGLIQRTTAVLAQRDAFARLLNRALNVLESSSDATFRREVAADIRVELGNQLSEPPPFIDDASRCAVCQWPLVDTVEKGCVRGNCSMRPMPERWYSRERYEREQAAMIKGVPEEQRGQLPEKWAACDEPADGDGVPACGWTGEMSQLVDRGNGVLFCPACGSSAIKEDITP